MENTNIRHFIGIDCAAYKFDAAWLKHPAKSAYRNKSLTNDAKGCLDLLAWIRKNVAEDLSTVHVAMEATGVYHEMLAYFLHDQGATVSIINPAYIAAHAKSLGKLHKTDKSDSQTIADYVYKNKDQLKTWQPEPRSVRQLKAKLERLDALRADLQRETNRLHTAKVADVPDEVMYSILQIIGALEQNIAALQKDADDHVDRHPELKRDIALLQSIPGVGKETAVRMTVLYRRKQFGKASQMAAFLGLIPRLRESGKYKGHIMLSKRGNGRMRALLYFPAVTACRFNPDIKAHCERLLGRGKTKMQVVGAAMRRLVHICFGVLKHQTAYCPQTVSV